MAPVAAQPLAPCPPMGGGVCDPYAAPQFVPGMVPPPMFGPVPAPPPIQMPPHVQPANRFWLRGEYLWWWTDGMEAPPLVTSSPEGTPLADAAVLGAADTQVLFGGTTLNDDAANGFRVRSGLWLTPQQSLALEAEYFQLFTQDTSFAASGDGTTILGRPYFDITSGAEAARLVSFPDVVAGEVRAASETELWSVLANARVALLPTTSAAYGTFEPSSRVDWILGYRYLELTDNLSIHENLEPIGVGVPDSIVASDSFATSNTFHGLQLGIVHHSNLNRLWLESMIRVAIGSNSQEVRVRGSTAITEGDATETYTGGLLAQRTNIGTRKANELTMIPELGVTLGWRITDCLHATVGYSILYFPNVVRATDQIDRDVNPNLIPPEADPFAGALRPRPLFETTDYWAHGLNVGGELRF